MNDKLILVDEIDMPTGTMDKLAVHQLGLLHRAFSVFIFNSKGELLLQQRSDAKYHSGGLWTNTCCSHPRFGEDLHDAVKRRLKEEMGMRCETSFAFNFVYKTSFENGLTEHEFDHVYIGVTDQLPIPDITEVQNWRYITLGDLEISVNTQPQLYSEWIKICLPKVLQHYKSLNFDKISLDYEYVSV